MIRYLFLLIVAATGFALPVSAAENPSLKSSNSSSGVVAITFISGVTAEAIQSLNRDMAYLYVYCDKCSQIDETNRRQDMGAWTVSKNNLWAPFIFQEYRNQYGSQRVILDPAIIDIDKNGNLILKTTLENGVVDRRILFLAYSEPYGYWGMKTIANFLIAIMVDIPSASGSGTDFDWKALHSSLIVPKKTPTVDGYASKASWESMMTVGPGKINGEVVRKAVQKAMKSGPIEANYSAGCADQYGILLGLPMLDEDLCTRMRSREVSFRITRSDQTMKLLTEGEYVQSLRDVAKAERQANLQIGQAAFAMALGGIAQTASGMAAGTPMNQISQSTLQANLEANQRLTTVSPAQLQASMKLTSTQTIVGSESVGDVNAISADSIAELRAKFLALASRKHK